MMLEDGLSKQNNLFWLVMVSDAFYITVTQFNILIVSWLNEKVTLLTHHPSSISLHNCVSLVSACVTL